MIATKYKILPLLLLPLLPACKTVTEQVSPNAEEALPDSRGTFLESEPQDSQPLNEDWWTLFKDPTLNNLIEQLNQANPDAQAALARVDQSFSVLGITRSALLPTLRGEASAGQRKDSINNLLFPISSPEYDRFAIGLSTSWEIDIWGRVKSSAKRDKFTAEGEEATYRGLVLSLQASLAQQYFAYQAARKELTYLERSRDLAAEKLKMEETRLSIGEGLQSDVSQAQSDLQSTESALEAAKRNIGKLQHALAILVGTLPSKFPEIETHSPAVPKIPVGLPSDLLVHRPDLLSVDRQLRSAAAQVGIRKVDFLPKITLLGNGGYASLNEENLFEKNSELFDIGPQISIPVFQYKYRKFLILQAKSKFQEIAANFKSTFLNAVKEVDDALLEVHSYTRELQLQRQTLAATTLSAQAAKDRYDTGLTDYFDFITAEQIRLQSAAQEANLSAEQLNATVRLIQALGGKW